jgi:hypothetical protein
MEFEKRKERMEKSKREERIKARILARSKRVSRRLTAIYPVIRLWGRIVYACMIGLVILMCYTGGSKIRLMTATVFCFLNLVSGIMMRTGKNLNFIERILYIIINIVITFVLHDGSIKLFTGPLSVHILNILTLIVPVLKIVLFSMMDINPLWDRYTDLKAYCPKCETKNSFVLAGVECVSDNSSTTLYKHDYDHGWFLDPETFQFQRLVYTATKTESSSCLKYFCWRYCSECGHLELCETIVRDIELFWQWPGYIIMPFFYRMKRRIDGGKFFDKGESTFEVVENAPEEIVKDDFKERNGIK